MSGLDVDLDRVREELEAFYGSRPLMSGLDVD